MERGHAEVLQQLCEFPAVDHLDRAAVQQLFFMTLRYHKDWQKTGDLLCGLNKLMRYLDDKTTLKLLRTATKVKSPEAVVHFYKPDLMEHLTSKHVRSCCRLLLQVCLFD